MLLLIKDIFGGIFMRKIGAILLSALLFCSCAVGNEEFSGEETETASVSETTSEASRTAEETTSATTASETDTTAETEPTEEEIILKPIASDKTFDAMECAISESFWEKNEEYFRNKEILAFAKEICFADEEVQSNIESHNSSIEEYELSEKPVESVDDIDFISGGAYDFDNDGEEEFLICLNYMPSWTFGCGFLVYIDGSKTDSDYKILGNGMGAAADASVINAGENTFFMVTTYAGATSYFQDIYSLESGMPEKVIDINRSHAYKYENGVFYCGIKYDDMVYPFVLCKDGIFRQIACEKISHEDFEAHVSGGKEFLDSLAEKGEEILEIYTYGYYSYKLYGYDFRYTMVENKGVYETYRHSLSKPYDGYKAPEYFTEEQICGADVHSVRGIVYTDSEIGGGYKIYAAREKDNTFTLYAADENGITDSIEISGDDLEYLYNRYTGYHRYPYLGFYDFDAPPCFALPTVRWGLTYNTYFIVDGKFRQGEWVLDGEKLDRIDYTLLTCFGNGNNEFVSYSAPGILWGGGMEPLIRRNFTFDRENLRFEGYSEPYPEPTGYAGIAAEVFKKYGEFVGGLYDYSPETVGELHESDLWLYKYEKEGFRTKAEVMERLREFCTESVAEQFYSYYIKGDLAEIDGIIYHLDGAPSHYESLKHIDSAEEKNGVITARVYAYTIGQDIPFFIDPPLYAELVQEKGVWKISKWELPR